MGLKVINLNYQDFKNFNYYFNNKTLYTIIGCNKSGKSTLFRILSGFIPNKSVICCNISPDLSNRKQYIKHIGVVECINKKSFLYKNVYDEMCYPLNNLNYGHEEINERIKKMLHYFDMEDIENKSINELNDIQKQTLLIMIALLHQPKVLLLDSCFESFNSSERKNLFDILNNIIHNEEITIINFTKELEDGLYSDKILLIKDYKFIKEINANDIVLNDKLFYDNNIEIPFIVDLNSKLRMYNLIDKDYYDMKELVDHIWP